MKLKFTGKDGSMGFKRGKTYDCEIGSKLKGRWVWVRTSIDGKIVCCPYSSFKALFENWMEV